MFEFLFKYPLAAFRKGELVLLGTWPHWWLAILIVLVAAALALLLLARPGRSAAASPSLAPAVAPVRRWRLASIWLLQAATAAVILGLLWEPALVVTELQPRQ